MCGICGFVGSGDADDVARMNRALAHRGPDGEGYWSHSERAVFLGHRRLSIVDLAGGRQPMCTPGGERVVVFNGEIYNHRELRAELEGLGCEFRSDHSDTEVLLHGYRVWGRSLPGHLNGMWAFVIYDAKACTLFASRDRFGKKPFFYTMVHGGFAFASELSALRAHAGIRPRLGLSRVALRKYFGYGYIPAPHTIWEKCWKLPSGHSLLLNLDEPTRPVVERYWKFELEPAPILDARQAGQRIEELRATIQKAVVRRLQADVPIGVFLSGGLDSSSIAALAAKNVPAGKLETFSIGFEEPSFDESGFARQVAAELRTVHHEERLSVEHARTLLPGVVAQMDEPLGDSSLLPTALLCQFAAGRVKVALGGDGGDELFAGYDPFRAVKMAETYSRIVPKPVHRALAALVARWPVSHRNMSFDFRLKRFLRSGDVPQRQWLPTWMAPLTPAELSEMFGEPVEPEEVFSEAIEAWDSCAQSDIVSRTIQFYVQLYLTDDILVKVDRASMMHGLEVRAPLLDLEVADVARRIPWDWKYRYGETKYILKRAMAGLLPPSIINRAKKGFGMPVGQWFQDGALKIADPALARTFTGRQQMEHRSGKRDNRAFLWNAWMLAEWQKANAA
jgi:asparagine synthase (glutamine-hydrolysing)